MTPDLQQSIDRLYHIAGLQDNWDGQGAIPVSDKVIGRVFKILPNLPMKPEMFPAVYDAISLEFSYGDTELDIEIYTENIEYYWNDGKEETQGFCTLSEMYEVIDAWWNTRGVL